MPHMGHGFLHAVASLHSMHAWALAPAGPHAEGADPQVGDDLHAALLAVAAAAHPGAKQVISGVKQVQMPLSSFTCSRRRQRQQDSVAAAVAEAQVRELHSRPRLHGCTAVLLLQQPGNNNQQRQGWQVAPVAAWTAAAAYDWTLYAALPACDTPYACVLLVTHYAPQAAPALQKGQNVAPSASG